MPHCRLARWADVEGLLVKAPGAAIMAHAIWVAAIAMGKVSFKLPAREPKADHKKPYFLSMIHRVFLCAVKLDIDQLNNVHDTLPTLLLDEAEQGRAQQKSQL